MKLILLFTIGIAFLILLPTAYFCFSKLLDLSASKKSAVNAAILLIIVFIVTIVGTGNLYTYAINGEEAVVAQRYANRLIRNAGNGDIETLKSDTDMISYEMDNLEDVFNEIKARGD